MRGFIALATWFAALLLVSALAPGVALGAPSRVVVTQVWLYDCVTTCPPPAGTFWLWSGPPAQRPTKLRGLGSGDTWNVPLEPALSQDGHLIASFQYGHGMTVTSVDRGFHQLGQPMRVPLGVTVDAGYVRATAVSPAGDRLAFLADVGRVPTLFTQRLDGSDVRTLVSGAPLRKPPMFTGDDQFDQISWSSTGRIAFPAGGSTGALWDVGSDGGPPRRLTTPGAGVADRAPVWNADGTGLVFVRGSRVRLLVSPGTSRATRIVDAAIAGAPSPDGRSVVTIREGGELCRLGATCKRSEVITNLATGHRSARALSPALSDDGYVTSVAWLP